MQRIAAKSLMRLLCFGVASIALLLCFVGCEKLEGVKEALMPQSEEALEPERMDEALDKATPKEMQQGEKEAMPTKKESSNEQMPAKPKTKFDQPHWEAIFTQITAKHGLLRLGCVRLSSEVLLAPLVDEAEAVFHAEDMKRPFLFAGEFGRTGFGVYLLDTEDETTKAQTEDKAKKQASNEKVNESAGLFDFVSEEKPPSWGETVRLIVKQKRRLLAFETEIAGVDAPKNEPIVLAANAFSDDAAGVVTDAAGAIVGLLSPKNVAGRAAFLPIRRFRSLNEVKTREALKEQALAYHAPKGEAIVIQKASDAIYLGLQVQQITPELWESFGKKGAIYGVLVSQVNPDSPAEAAGFELGDILLALDEQRISAIEQLPNIIAALQPNHFVSATLLRQGETLTLQIKPRLRPGLY